MGGAPVFLYCPKPYCKLLFSDFLLSTIPDWNKCKSLMCDCNRNTPNDTFAFSVAEH